MNHDEQAVRIKARKLIVLATAHELQGEKFNHSIYDQCYCDLLEQLTSTLKPDFVFEEAAGHSPTHAELAAKNRPDPISYMDVDPPRDERNQHGLSEDTGDGYVVDLWQSPPCVGRTENVGAHEAREEYWLKRIVQQTFNCALMVCGEAHGLSFSFRLRGAGFEVEKCINYTPHAKLCGHLK